MSDFEFFNLGREAAGHIAERRRIDTARVYATTGKHLPDGSWIVPDTSEASRVWVKINDNEAETKSVLNKKTGVDRFKPGIAVWLVWLDDERIYEVDSLAGPSKQSALPDTLLSSAETPTQAGDTKTDTTPNASLKNLRVRTYKDPATGAYGLKVWIEPGYFYVGTTQYYWPGGALDLTPYLPSSSGMKAPVIIGIDSATLTAVAYKGTEVVQSLPPVGSPYFYGDAFTAARNAATGGDVWLFGIGLLYGQTSITDQADFVDLRTEQISGTLTSINDATISAVGGLLLDQSVVSGHPIALTLARLAAALGVAMLGGDSRVPSFELAPGPVVSVSETSRWTRYGVTLAASVPWEQSVLQEPNVFYEDGVWTMFYTGGYANPAIGRATSTDGQTWTKYASNPILGQGVGGVAGFVAHTGVFKYQDTWYLYFSNSTSSPDLAYATSPDGITWTYQGIAIAHNQVAWSDNWFNSTIWVEDGNQFKMLVEGKASGGGSVYFITLATATSPVGPWTFPTGGPLTSLQVHAGGGYSGPMMPTPNKVNGRYELWYHACGTTTGVLPTELYRAYSTDLITWTQYSHNPLLSPSGVSPEIDQTADPDVHEVNGQSYLYYEGFDNVTPVAGIKLLTFAGPLGALVNEEGLIAYLDANNLLPAANVPTATTSALGGVKVDGSSITIIDGVISATPSTSSGGNHLHGITRWTGDGSTTTFDLPDIAEYLEWASNAGSIVDSALITLSSDGTQVTFSSAPTAANVLQAEYVIASL